MIDCLLLSAMFLAAIAVFALAIQQARDIRNAQLRIDALKSELAELEDDPSLFQSAALEDPDDQWRVYYNDKIFPILYRDKHYHTRLIPSPIPNRGMVRVATTDLLNAFGGRENDTETIEATIDSHFTFYVEPSEITLPWKQLQRIIEPDLTWVRGTVDLGSIDVFVAVENYPKDDSAAIVKAGEEYGVQEALEASGFDYEEVEKALAVLGVEIDGVTFHDVDK